MRVDVLRPGELEVEFITPEVGEHVIEVKVQGRPLPGSPFRSHAFDATKIRVGDVPNGTVGRPVEFESKCPIYIFVTESSLPQCHSLFASFIGMFIFVEPGIPACTDVCKLAET